MLIDSHCHLTERKFSEDLGEVIKQAKEDGVEKIIVPATDLKDSEQVSRIVARFENIFGLVGVHPESVAGIKNQESRIETEIRRLIAENKKIVGIGEIGLDCYWNRRDLPKQRDVFKAQLELAREIDMPVAIHSRSSAVEIRGVFEELDDLPRGQFHCFGEDRGFLKYVLSKGFYVSFGGNVTFKSAEKLRDLAKMVPTDRLLVETDAPFLSPEPLRGTRNEPKNVKITAGFLALLKGISFEGLAKRTSENTERLYGI